MENYLMENIALWSVRCEPCNRFSNAINSGKPPHGAKPLVTTKQFRTFCDITGPSNFFVTSLVLDFFILVFLLVLYSVNINYFF